MADDTLACPACGCRVPAGAETCPFCGTALRGAPGTAPRAPEPAQRPDAAPPRPAHLAPAPHRATDGPVAGTADDAAAGGAPLRSAPAPAGAPAGEPRSPDDAGAVHASSHPGIPEDFLARDRAAHPHGEGRRRSATDAVRRSVEGMDRRALRRAGAVALIVAAVALIAAVGLAWNADTQLRLRAEQAAQGGGDAGSDDAPSIALPAEGFGGGFLTRAGDELLWAASDGIYSASTDALASGDAQPEAVVEGVDADFLYADGDGSLVFVADGTRLCRISEAGAGDAEELYAAADGARIDGFVLRGGTALIAVTGPAPEGGDAASGAGETAADPEDDATGDAADAVSLLAADLTAAGAPAWATVLSVPADRAWLFDAGGRVSLLSTDDASWSLRAADASGIDASGATAAAFRELMHGGERIEAAFFDGEELYSTAGDGSGAVRTARQELGGAFDDYQAVAGVPLMAGGSSACVMVTQNGGLAWVDAGTGFLNDISTALDGLGSEPGPSTCRLAVDGTTAFLLVESAAGHGTLAAVDLDADPVGAAVIVK